MTKAFWSGNFVAFNVSYRMFSLYRCMAYTVSIYFRVYFTRANMFSLPKLQIYSNRLLCFAFVSFMPFTFELFEKATNSVLGLLKTFVPTIGRNIKKLYLNEESWWRIYAKTQFSILNLPTVSSHRTWICTNYSNEAQFIISIYFFYRTQNNRTANREKQLMFSISVASNLRQKLCEFNNRAINSAKSQYIFWEKKIKNKTRQQLIAYE